MALGHGVTSWCSQGAALWARPAGLPPARTRCRHSVTQGMETGAGCSSSCACRFLGTCSRAHGGGPRHTGGGPRHTGGGLVACSVPSAQRRHAAPLRRPARYCQKSGKGGLIRSRPRGGRVRVGGSNRREGGNLAWWRPAGPLRLYLGLTSLARSVGATTRSSCGWERPAPHGGR